MQHTPHDIVAFRKDMMRMRNMRFTLRARPIKTCFIGITCDSMPLIELIR